MPARGPCDQLTTATRSPWALLERLTLSGAPMPRTTSHSVWPSATVPVAVGAAAAPSDKALAFAGTPAVIPGQAPSALTKSSRLTGLSGVRGGVSIDTFLMKALPLRENPSASFDKRSDEKKSDVAAQPAIMGAHSISVSTDFR